MALVVFKSADISPENRAALRSLFRAYAYLCAVLAGVTMAIARGQVQLPWFDRVAGVVSLFWLACVLWFVLQSSEEPEKRFRRLWKSCVVIALSVVVTTAITRVIGVDYTLIDLHLRAVGRLNVADIGAIFFGTLSNLMWLIFLRLRKMRFRDAIPDALPAYGLGLLTAIGAAVMVSMG